MHLQKHNEPTSSSFWLLYTCDLIETTEEEKEEGIVLFLSFSSTPRSNVTVTSLLVPTFEKLGGVLAHVCIPRGIY